MRHILTGFLVALLPVVAGAQVDQGPPNAEFEPVFADQTRAPALPQTALDVTVFASGLDFPWGIAALPDGGFLMTERGGRMRLLDGNGALVGEISGLPRVDANNQGGLLDVAVSPQFADDGVIYWTYSKPAGNGAALAVGTGTLDGDTIIGARDIFVQSPVQRGGRHFGSRIIPDGDSLWVTSGDRGTPELAQGNNTIGKVLRITNGAVELWSTGHRNIQGATLRRGALWTVEHGPRGGDELNKPQRGLNYGWPIVSYGIDYNGSDIGGGIAVADGMEQPIYYWDPVIAPGGMAAYPDDAAHAPWRSNLFVSSLRPGGVMRLAVENDRVVGEERLLPDVGRVRDIELLENGDLLVLLDAPDADILRVRPRP